jgi:RNA polymerase sigma factor (sigma-70 family)
MERDNASGPADRVAAAGDAPARRLYREHESLALRAANRLMPMFAGALSAGLADADREDIRQEARLILWHVCGRYTGEAERFAPYAKAALRNRLIDLADRWRQVRLRSVPSVRAGDLGGADSSTYDLWEHLADADAPDPLACAVASEIEDALHEAIRLRLTRRQREALGRYFWGNQTLAEIAAQSERRTSKGHVLETLQRAYVRLRKDPALQGLR